jgi:hypothetical protein
MITLAGAVIGVALWLAWRWGVLSVGSCVTGVLVGLVLAGTSVGSPMADGVHATADSIGKSIKAGVSEAIK